MSSFKKCGADVRNILNETLTQFSCYQPLLDAKVTFDLLFAFAPVDEAGDRTGPAISKNGVPALGIASKSNLKDRALDRADCLVILDGDWWNDPDTEPKARRALLDHELYHFMVVLDEMGPELDSCRRPKIEIRNHDFQFGWFRDVAARHGEFSQERIQAKAMLASTPQLFLPGIMEPWSDDETENKIGEALVKSTAKLAGNIGKPGSSISSMTISSGGKSVTIDAAAAKRIRQAAESME